MVKTNTLLKKDKIHLFSDQIQKIPLAELHHFEDHPFKVRDDEEMQETAIGESTNTGISMPSTICVNCLRCSEGDITTT